MSIYTYLVLIKWCEKRSNELGKTQKFGSCFLVDSYYYNGVYNNNFPKNKTKLKDQALRLKSRKIEEEETMY